MDHEQEFDLVELGTASAVTEGFLGYPMEADGLWIKEGLSPE